jgi:hypothetical protein
MQTSTALMARSAAGVSDDDEDDDGSFLQFSSFEDCLKSLQKWEQKNSSKRTKSLREPPTEAPARVPSLSQILVQIPSPDKMEILNFPVKIYLFGFSCHGP